MTLARTALGQLDGLSYCILHDFDSIPNNINSDVDFIISPKDLLIFIERLIICGELRIFNVLQHESTCFYFIVGASDVPCRSFLALDSATDYRRNGRVWLTGECALADSEERRGYKASSPKVEYDYLLIKKSLKADFSPSSRERLRVLQKRLGNEAEGVAIRRFGNTLAKELMADIATGRWSNLQANAARFRTTMRLRRWLEDPLNPLRYLVPEFRRIIQRWLHPTGLSITFLGLDGAGKSSVIDSMRSDLTPLFRRQRAYHLSPGLWRRAVGGQVTDPHGKPPRARPASLAKLLYWLADYAFGYVYRVYPAMVRSTLVIFDRYYDDLLVDPGRYRFAGLTSLANLVGRLVPRPDLYILLDVPAETAHARKPEVPLPDARALRERYRALAERLPNAHLVDASQSLDQVVHAVNGIVLDHMERRTRRRLLRMFPTLRSSVQPSAP